MYKKIIIHSLIIFAVWNCKKSFLSDIRGQKNQSQAVLETNFEHCKINAFDDSSLSLADNVFYSLFDDAFLQVLPTIVPKTDAFKDFSAKMDETSLKIIYENEFVADIDFFYKDQPFCNLNTRAFFKNDVFSLYPMVNLGKKIAPEILVAAKNFESKELNLEKLISSIKENILEVTKISLYRSEACVYLDKKELKSAHRVFFYATLENLLEENVHRPAMLPYEGIIIDNKFKELQPIYATFNGQFEVHNLDQTTPIASHSVSGMQGSGYLCSANAVTTMPEGFQLSYSPELDFSYPESDPRFLEISAFAYINELFDLLNKLGFPNWAKSQIVLRLIFDPTQSGSGPFYVNPEFSGEKFAVINITTEIPNQLDNLAVNKSALWHELIHHFLYPYLGINSKEETKILHEGLADSVVQRLLNISTMAANTCLPQATICSLPKDLRTADNNLVYQSPEYSQRPMHRKSELISGIFYDLAQKSPPLDNDMVTALLLRTMTYIPIHAGFSEFFDSLFHGEQVLFSKKYQCQIEKVLFNRGLQQFIPPDVLKNCGD